MDRRAAAGGHGEPGERLEVQQGAEFSEGGVVATDDSVYTGFGFEGMNAAARPRVHAARAWRTSALAGEPAGGPGDGRRHPAPGATRSGPKAQGADQGEAGKLRLDRKGRVAVRLAVRG